MRGGSSHSADCGQLKETPVSTCTRVRIVGHASKRDRRVRERESHCRMDQASGQYDQDYPTHDPTDSSRSSDNEEDDQQPPQAD